MKKIILILVLLGFIVIAGIAAFVLTFDLNRYRPQIEKQATAAVGQPVKIGNLSLAWRGGLAIEIDGVQILSNDEPVLKVQSAGAVLEIAPLLRRSIQIGSIFLDGAEIRIVKTPDGKTEIQGLQSFGSGASPQPPESSSDSVTLPPASPTPPPAWSSFLIGSLSLKDIHVHYEDDTPASPVQLDLRKIEVIVKNVSLFRPMEFQVAAALFGAKQNVHFSGRLKVADQGARINVESFKAEVDLGAMDLSEVANSLPNLMARSPVSSLKGKLSADVDQLSFRNGKLDEFQADVTLSDGEVSAFGASPLLDHVQINVNRFRLNEPVDFKIKSDVVARGPFAIGRI